MGPRAERVVWTALHVPRQIGTSREHLGRRHPVRPRGLAADLGAPEPLETFAPDADAVAKGSVVLESDVQGVILGIDDETTRGLLVDVLDELAPVARRDPVHVGAAEGEAPVL